MCNSIKMFSFKNSNVVYFCTFIVIKLFLVSIVQGQYPYPGVFYPPSPPPLFTSSAIYPISAPAPYAFPFFPSYFGSQCYPALPSLHTQVEPQQSNGNSKTNSASGYIKPKIVKPLRVRGGSGSVILSNRGAGDSNPPIIISTRPSRTPQQPTLLSPFTNLIHTFLKSLAPRTCDCDGD